MSRSPGTAQVRWILRLSSLVEALKQLQAACDLTTIRALSDLEKQGLIQAFEFTHELAWNTMKDFFEYQGNSTIRGARDASREAFQMGLIGNGDVWMEMIQSRNLTSHTYNRPLADQICAKIVSEYVGEFHTLSRSLQALKPK